jgi:bifunctional non-homologous end joining protein LigD
VVVEDESGVSNFQTLQADLSAARSDRMVLHLFDLLYLDGRDWRGEPLEDRKGRLSALLSGSSPAPLRYSDHLVGDGVAMARHACRLGLEGIVCKRRNAPYRSGRTGAWLKVKCTVSEDVVIAGYVPSSTSARAIGSLVVGQMEAGRLVHVGRVGTGFGRDMAEVLRARLEAARRPDPPFDGTLPAGAARGVRWIEPALVAEVNVRGRTADGLLRHASFKGLRDDKAPADAIREGTDGGAAMAARPTRNRPAATDRSRTAANRGGRADRADPPAAAASANAPELTHPDRIYWPDEGITKEGLAAYHAAVADLILPHVAGRPLALVRCPGGIGEGCFFQKHAWAGMAGPIRRSVIGDDAVLSIDDADGLLALVQAGVLEIHPWGARLDDPERPERVVIDLDPDEGLDWGLVVDAAHEVRRRLAAMDLVGFAKTTGGKGLHVVVPLAPDAGWDRVRGFAADLARAMAADIPDRFTATAAKAARKGRIYVDWLRNARGATAVAAYSPRARPHAAVSTPLAWDELSPAIRPGQFTIRTLPGRIAHLASDPWDGIDTLDQRLPAATTRRRGRR